MKKIFQILLFLLALIPVIFGTWAVIAGVTPSMNISASELPRELANQFRYLSGIYVGIGLMILWTIPRITKEITIFRFLVMLIFFGGLARLWAFIDLGYTNPTQFSGLFLELGSPLLLLWHNRILKSSKLKD